MEHLPFCSDAKDRFQRSGTVTPFCRFLAVTIDNLKELATIFSKQKRRKKFHTDLEQGGVTRLLER
ncbi:hypothetical protein COU80_06190 [Candidatus Peregrinibacteria bacterium CG10_big_fil_rev_8_21_14_0_10_55_24]|nr:MAG: hypothetical protein COU80_06190 [Candidatus Peregrinibacteria bacterium CG10_big_fil_rev_8_21_14_0_10_55_24]